VTISRQQVINRIRDEDFKYHDKRKRVELFRKKGTQDYVVIPLRDLLPETLVRVILSQAGLTPRQVDEFVADAVK